MINFIVSTIRIIMTWTCKITLKCTLKFKILGLIQCIVETDNNDVYVRDMVNKMQMVFFKIVGRQVAEPKSYFATFLNFPQKNSINSFSRAKQVCSSSFLALEPALEWMTLLLHGLLGIIEHNFKNLTK